VQKRVQGAILATDMGRHGEDLKEFNLLLAEKTDFSKDF
jgi:hypothetical protein